MVEDGGMTKGSNECNSLYGLGDGLVSVETVNVLKTRLDRHP